jgi:hypothetical protein
MNRAIVAVPRWERRSIGFFSIDDQLTSFLVSIHRRPVPCGGQKIRTDRFVAFDRVEI